jgi:hypothetical protein
VSIELHIERLVIDEALLGGESAGNVRDELERELTQRLARSGAIDTLRGLGTVTALPPATVPAAMHPQQTLGPRIAAAVQKGLGISATSRIASKEH